MTRLLLEEGTFYELQISQQRPTNLTDEAIPFAGSLRLHYNPGLVLLLLHPQESNSMLYEFRVDDIVYAEKLASLTRESGVTVERVRLWIRKGAPAMQMKPVRVNESLEHDAEG
jgi:inorganic pyrophosphatase